MYHKAYVVDTLKVEIEAVKGRKMSFSHSYYNLLRFFRKMAVTSILILEPDRVRKDVLVVTRLAIFIFSVVSYGLWAFPSVPISSIRNPTGALSTSCNSHEMSSRVVGHEVVDHKVSSENPRWRPMTSFEMVDDIIHRLLGRWHHHSY